MMSNHQVSGAKAPGPIWRSFSALLSALDRTSYWAIVMAMALMTLLVSTQVLARYLFSYSIDSADELSRLFFVWAIFLAIPQGIKVGIHVGIDVVVTKLPEHWQVWMARLTAALSAILMGFVLWVAFIAVQDKWQELMPTVEVTAAVFYIAVLICAAHSLLHLIKLVVDPAPHRVEGETL